MGEHNWLQLTRMPRATETTTKARSALNSPSRCGLAGIAATTALTTVKYGLCRLDRLAGPGDAIINSPGSAAANVGLYRFCPPQRMGAKRAWVETGAPNLVCPKARGWLKDLTKSLTTGVIYASLMLAIG